MITATVQWWIQDGAFGANAPPPPLPDVVEEPTILLVNTKAKISLLTHENMHILLVLLQIHLKPKRTKLAVKLSISTFLRTKRL